MCAQTEPWPPTEAALARLLTRLENAPTAAPSLLAGLPRPVAPAWRIGISGAPGAGKSTLIARLLELWRDERLAVLAFDPSSPQSGGAVLGDRLRYGEARGAFVRSLASRGSLGGLSLAAPAMAAALEAAGYARIILETVGSGQTGADIAGFADTVVVLFTPESGDGLQLLKAGLLEAGDIALVSKADRPGAEALQSDLRLALHSSRWNAAGAAHPGPTPAPGSGALEDPAAWAVPVLAVSALAGQGVAALAEALLAHRAWLERLPAAHPRRLRRRRAELAFLLRSRVEALLHGPLREPLTAAAQAIASGNTDVWSAVERLEAELRAGL